MMKLWRITLLVAIYCLLSAVAFAAGPKASPDGQIIKTPTEIASPQIKSFTDPVDFKAAALAGANYLRYMQADVTEDNAGNGFTDTDPDDGGWDWQTSILEHSASVSPGNITGVTANGMLQVYLFNPDPALWIALVDAADMMVVRGPTEVRSGPDVIFLLDMAAMPGVADPSSYRNGALAIWDYRMATYGTATVFGEALRDYRGNGGWPNGIIPWDLASWADALMKMDTAFPGMGYHAMAVEIAEVAWQDSFNANPGFFEPHVQNKGALADYSDNKFWFYSGGVASLIRAFSVTGTHLTSIPGLWNELLDCQYPDGGFSYQYGANAGFNDRDYQSSAYSLMVFHDNLPFQGASIDAFQRGVIWLSTAQDVSGGFLYSDSSHTPEEGGECTVALAYGYTTMSAALTTTVSSGGPLGCGVEQVATVGFDRSVGTVGVRGYEITLQVNGPVDAVSVASFGDSGSLAGLGDNYFRAINNGNGTFTISDAVLGVTDGLLADAPLFTITLMGNADGQVDIEILDYKLRDPNNIPVFAEFSGASYMIDCTPPAAVSGIMAETHHNRVVVSWVHDGAETAVYEVYRGLWYDNDNGGDSAYPEYDDLVNDMTPTRPADRAAAATPGEWVLAGTVTVGSNTLEDIYNNAPVRGVYYYEVFAVDAADNGSLAADANDRATNYWLGDIDGDGFVDVISDITALGACFATDPGHGNYDAFCDVGPTDDWSRLGIPLTDNLIDFEDLMVFAMNFAIVSDINKTGSAVASFAQLAWIQVAEGQYALRLVSGSGIKGVHVRANLTDGASVEISQGSLLADQSQMFFRTVGEDLDVNLAVMGTGSSISGFGDLFVVETAAAIDLTDLDITLRDADNAEIEFNLDSTSSVTTPHAYALGSNYPNPFNPMTKISFSLPEAQKVMLSVYSLDGRRVATLVNETREAGLHEVIWSGRNDAGQIVASGAYFYRIDAGQYSQVRKMTLMK